MSWEVPVKDIRLVHILPDYLAEYMGIEAVEGIFSKFVEENKFVPDKLFTLGYKVYQYQNAPRKVAIIGANDIANLIAVPQTETERKITKGEIIRKIGGYIDEFMKTVARIGGAVAGRVLAEKVARAAGTYNIPESEIYNKTLAWAIENQETLKKLGYPSPEAAAASALWINGGLPPKPDQSPYEVLRIKKEEEEKREVIDVQKIKDFMSEYWWLILPITLGLLIRR